MDSSDSNKPRLCDVTVMRIDTSELTSKHGRGRIELNNYNIDTLKIISNSDIDIELYIRDSNIRTIEISGDTRLKLVTLEIHNSRIDSGLDYLLKLDIVNLVLDTMRLSDIILKNKYNITVRLNNIKIRRLCLSKSTIKLYYVENTSVEILDLSEVTLKSTEKALKNLNATCATKQLNNVGIIPLYIGNIKEGFVKYKIGEILHKIKVRTKRKKILDEYLDIFNETSEENQITLVV